MIKDQIFGGVGPFSMKQPISNTSTYDIPEGAQEYNSLEVSTTPVHLCVQV